MCASPRCPPKPTPPLLPSSVSTAWMTLAPKMDRSSSSALSRRMSTHMSGSRPEMDAASAAEEASPSGRGAGISSPISLRAAVISSMPSSSTASPSSSPPSSSSSRSRSTLRRFSFLTAPSPDAPSTSIGSAGGSADPSVFGSADPSAFSRRFSATAASAAAAPPPPPDTDASTDPRAAILAAPVAPTLGTGGSPGENTSVLERIHGPRSSSATLFQSTSNLRLAITAHTSRTPLDGGLRASRAWTRHAPGTPSGET
mmetsp:Transcript_12854/g.50302  ORF Transcript_12854/g.50302 Transcript_12854/m.50302 type:complete len:257 (-) Transcript_12854:498-1268(-)